MISTITQIDDNVEIVMVRGFTLTELQEYIDYYMVIFPPYQYCTIVDTKPYTDGKIWFCRLYRFLNKVNKISEKSPSPENHDNDTVLGF